VHDHDAVGEGPVERAASTGERVRRSAAGRAARSSAVAAPAVAYAWWAVTRPPFSAAATVAVVGAGAAAAVAGSRGRRRPRPHVAGKAALPWAVLVVVTALWQAAAFVQDPRHDHPTLSSLANGLLDSGPARVAAFLAWMGAMAGLSRR
jgi:hypothetical protein